MIYRTLFAACAVVCSATTLTAGTNTILVTATRTQNDIQSIPGNPTVITSAELKQGGFRAVPTALNKRAGIHIRNFSDNPNRASVDVRGFGENSHGRVLILINGRRINRPDLGPLNWSQIPIETIDRIEVVRGAHTTLYGDYAAAGVINIITHRGQEESRLELGVMAGSHGFNNETLSISGDLDGVGYAVSLGHQSSDGYRERSEYETWFNTLSLETDTTDYLNTWLDYSFTDSEYEMPGGLTEAQLKQDRRQAVNKADDAKDSFHNIGFGIGIYPNEHHQGTVDIGYSRKKFESNMASWFSFNTWDINTYSLSPKHVYSTALFQMDNELTLGVDATYDALNIALYGDRNHTLKNGSSDVEKETAGLYAYNSLSVLDHLILSIGARTERAEYSIKERDGADLLQQDTSDTHQVEAYNAGITYLPAESVKLFARFDKLYRLPFLDEQIFYQGYGSGFNKDLQPETGKSYEVGFSVSPSDDLDVHCTFFRMDMKDEIAYAVTNFVTFEGSNFNMDKTRHQGVELSGNWQALDNLGLFANYTFQHVEFTGGANKGNNMPLVPENIVSAGCDIELLDDLHILADVTFTDEQFAGSAVDNSSGTELDAYAVVDMAARYTHAFKRNEMDFFVGIDNVFDEAYSPMAYGGFGTIFSYYPAAERTYKAGVNVRF